PLRGVLVNLVRRVQFVDVKGGSHIEGYAYSNGAKYLIPLRIRNTLSPDVVFDINSMTHCWSPRAAT
ncbi:hypothetical protein LINGRAHAP2_LOCUS26045, partial [Linum grandiflorum]